MDRARPAVVPALDAAVDPAVAAAPASPIAPARWVPAVLAAVPFTILTLFFAWPLIVIAARGAHLSALRAAIANGATAKVVWFTFWQAALSTIATVIVALPLTAALARFRFPGRRAVVALVGVPFVLPTVVVATALSATLPRSWDNSVRAIIIAHVFFNVAVIVRTVGAAWAQLDPRYEDAARTLGAGRWHATRTIVAPLLRGPVASSCAIVFLFCFTSFGVVRILGGPRHPTLEVEIYLRAAQQVDLRAASALGLVQLAAVLAVLAVWSRTQRRAAPAMAMRNRPPAAHPVRASEKVFIAASVLGTMSALAIPIARLVERSLSVGNGHGLTWYRTLTSAGRGTTRALRPVASFATSMTTALYAAAIATVVGALAAASLAYGPRSRVAARRVGSFGGAGAPSTDPTLGGRLLNIGVMLPLGTSAVTVGLGLFVAFGHPPLDWRASPFLVPLAHALIGIPFVVRAVTPTLQSIDPRLRDAAATLGASRWRTFVTVDLPLARRTLVVAAGMAFAVSLGEFGATSFLARRATPTVPIEIAALLARPGRANLGQAQALSVILAAVVALVFVLTDRLAEPSARW